MKFLHTADIHLKRNAPERFDILQWIVEKAHELSVDYIIIAGDLFDSSADATILNADVKRIFDQARFTVLLIPGNHDVQEPGKNNVLGEQVRQFTAPYSVVDCQGISVCGIPYQQIDFSECARLIPKETGIIIAHGTLYDPSFIFTMLDDEETTYMPMYPAHFKDKARYVALGHLHSRYIEKKYGATKVVYPGSPIALDTKCTEQRRCALVSIDKEHLEVEQVPVEIAPYWHTKEIFVFPAIENEITQRLAKELEEIPKKMLANIKIRGFIGSGESSFKKQITTTTQVFTNRFSDLKVDIRVNSWDSIIANPMVKRFVNKTMALDEKLRLKTYEIAFPVFCDILK
jgi:exonuclease SbcD